MKRLLTAHASAVALLLAFGAGAQASTLPPSSVAWSYNWSPGSPAVTADGNPSAGVTFTNEPTKVAVGHSDIVASNIRVFSSATAAAPDVLASSGAYSLNLQLSVNDNGQAYTQTLSFGGKLAGILSAEAAQISNVFDPAMKKQTVNLGSYKFEVELIGYVGPGPQDQSNAGSISAHVTVSKITPAQVPEPSTMLLSGLGLTFLGGAAWRKRRAAKTAQA